MKKFPVVIFVLLLAALNIFAQNPVPTPPDDGDIIKITTTLIQIDVGVTDKKGKQITNLKPENFEVLENGKVQKITNFSYVAVSSETKAEAAKNAPDSKASRIPPIPIKLRPEQVRRTIVLVVDDLGLGVGSIHWVKEALNKFVNEQMQPDDLVAIIRTGSSVGALQQFTSDKRLLLAAISKIRWNMTSRSGLFTFEPIQPTIKDLKNGKVNADGTTQNSPGNARDKENQKNANEFRSETYTVGTLGTLRYIVSGLSKLPGRKSLLLFSDGLKISEGNLERTQINLEIEGQMKRLVEAANRAGVVINTIDAKGLDDAGFMGPENDTRGLSFEQIDALENSRRDDFIKMQEGMSYLAYGTGGRPVKNTNDLGSAIAKILSAEAGYYLIAYEPDENTFNPKTNKFNKLEVRVKIPDARVSYRSGFFGITDSDMAKTTDTVKDQLQTALTSPFGSKDIETRLTSVFASDAKVGDYSRALLHIDLNGLEFADQPDGSKRVSLDIYAYVFGPDGAAKSYLSKNYVFAVRADSIPRLLEKGIIFPINVPIEKPGAYQLRMAVRDTNSGKIGSASQFIEVPDLKKEHLALSGIVVQNLTLAQLKALSANGEDHSSAKTLEDTATRVFKRGTVLIYNYAIYNAKNAGQGVQLNTYARLFREGSLVYESAPSPVNTTGQIDLGHIEDRGVLALGSELAPGDYVLQIVTVDPLAKEKDQLAAQSIDFEVIE